MDNKNDTLKVNLKYVGKLAWIGVKIAIVLFAIFQASNLTILYQGF